MATLYRRNGLYYVKFILDGVEVRRSLKTRDAEKAKAEKEALEAILSGARVPVPKDTTPAEFSFSELKTAIRKWGFRHTRERTREVREYAMAKWEAWATVDSLTAVTPDMVEDWKDHLLQTLSERSVNICINNMAQIVNRAKRQRWYFGSNPFADVERFRERRREPRWLEKHQIEAIMETAELHSRTQHLVFALGIYAGLRKREIVFSRGEWFRVARSENRNGAAGVIHIQGDPPAFELKDGEARSIPLHPTLLDVLDRYGGDTPGYLIEPSRPSAKGPYRFNIRKGFASVLKAAGKALGETDETTPKLVDWVSPHVLRHTFASQLVSAGVELYKVQKWLGHSAPVTTMIYAHLRPADDDIGRF